jgi:hypothetical protein
MNLEEAIIELAIQTPLSPADLRGFLDCSPLERVALVEAYKRAGTMASRGTWDIVLSVLRTVADGAVIVSEIAGAVTAVFGVAAVV